MIKIIKGIKEEIYFATDLSVFKFVKPVVYLQANINTSLFGFIKKSKHTKLVRLQNNDYFNDFKNNTRNEIRKAEKAGINFEIEQDTNRFTNLYNSFAESKGLKRLPATFNSYTNHLVITKAVLNNEIICLHSFLIDRESKRSRLLHSVSTFRNISADQKSLAGSANRFLHYYDMNYFKSDGFLFYDFGGYAMNSTDPVLQNINQFKDSFGGELVEEWNYTSLASYLINLIKK